MTDRPEYVEKIQDGSGQAQVAKDGYMMRKNKENSVQLKLRKMIQSDEQKAINKHNEGVCYGCMRRDYILSSIFFCCHDCMHKRGTEALYTIVYHKPGEELCDFCGRWQRPFDTWQINCGLCEHCMSKLHAFHKRYRDEGGKAQQPYKKKMRRKYGKDYRLLLQQAEPVKI